MLYSQADANVCSCSESEKETRGRRNPHNRLVVHLCTSPSEIMDGFSLTMVGEPLVNVQSLA